MRTAWWMIGGCGLVLGFTLGWFAGSKQRPKAIEDEKDAEPDSESVEAQYAKLEPLLESARSVAAREPPDRDALSALATIEDEIRTGFERVYRRWQSHLEDAALIEQKEQCERMYKEILQLSDGAVERFFTPDGIAMVPWRDLLAPEQASLWKSNTLKGFEHRLVKGVLYIVGPDAAEQNEGLLHIGDEEVWRDYVLDVQFTMMRGECSLFFRLPPVYQENVLEYDFFTTATDEDGLEAGRSYAYSFSVIASTLISECREDGFGPSAEKVHWTKVRKGALGITVSKDTEIEFTRLRIKLLR